MGHQPGAGDVELDDGPEALRADRLGGAEELPAGVVDERVDAPVALEDPVDEAVDGLLVADVERLVLGLAAERLDRGNHLRDRLLAPPAADDGRAEPARARAPSPCRGRYRRRRRCRPGRRAGRAQICVSSPAPSRAKAICLNPLAMSIRAEAKRLTQPLPGGQAGASVVVEPLKVGEMRCARSFIEKATPFPVLRMAGLAATESVTIPVPAFLVRHPKAGAFLVDTGFHPSVGSKPTENLGGLLGRFSHPSLDPAEELAVQLRARDVDLKSIRLVVMTHMHFDHTSGMSEVPDATFVLSRGRVGGGDRRQPAVAERLPPRPLQLRLRLPDDLLRLRLGRLLRELRPHLRPVRRRQRPARLDARPQRRPPVGDLPARRPRLRDRRRRRLHDGAARRRSRAAAAARPPQLAPLACASWRDSPPSTPTRRSRPGTTPSSGRRSRRATSSGDPRRSRRADRRRPHRRGGSSGRRSSGPRARVASTSP